MDLSIIVMGIQYAAIAIAAIDSLYVMRQRPSELQKYLILLLLATIAMFVGYNIELTSSNMSEAMAGVVVAYIGKPFIMLTSFLFICKFYGIEVHKHLVTALAFISLLFPILVTTNSYHHLYYATVNWDPEGEYSKLLLTRGPAYYLYIVCAVAFFIGCLYVTIKGYKASKLKNRKHHLRYIVGMIISGIGGYAIYLSGITGGYDFTMVGVFFGTVFLSLLFMKSNLVDPVTLAKSQALEDSYIGLIVFDNNDKAIYKNRGMKTIIENGFKVEKLKRMENGSIEYTIGEKRYSFIKSILESSEGTIGTVIEAYDVSESFFYQQKLEKEVKLRTQELERMQREVIASVASIVEARSFETGEHIKRTSLYVEMTARALIDMGLYQEEITEEFIDLLAQAAPLHDIGKISIPDGILKKPAKLTDEEFEIMKTHTVSGADIIEESIRGIERDEYVDVARDVAKYHHERWDGTGYPEKLSGSKIPLSARIMAIADCYDAISSKRCYKEAASQEETLAIIKAESGTHFDPTVVHAFLTAMHEKEKN